VRPTRSDDLPGGLHIAGSRHPVAVTLRTVRLESAGAFRDGARVNDILRQRIDLGIAQLLTPWRHFEVHPALADDIEQLRAVA
jgi:hypothetical protein